MMQIRGLLATRFALSQIAGTHIKHERMYLQPP